MDIPEIGQLFEIRLTYYDDFIGLAIPIKHTSDPMNYDNFKQHSGFQNKSQKVLFIKLSYPFEEFEGKFGYLSYGYLTVNIESFYFTVAPTIKIIQ